jgi:hypothetical protein
MRLFGIGSAFFIMVVVMSGAVTPRSSTTVAQGWESERASGYPLFTR